MHMMHTIMHVIMHIVCCECAVYRPGNCRETPKNLIFQEREKELREEHRRHRRFRDRDDDELRTESWLVLCKSLQHKKVVENGVQEDKNRPCPLRLLNSFLFNHTLGIDLCPAGCPE